jgi:hypothetical protein
VEGAKLFLRSQKESDTIPPINILIVFKTSGVNWMTKVRNAAMILKLFYFSLDEEVGESEGLAIKETSVTDF